MRLIYLFAFIFCCLSCSENSLPFLKKQGPYERYVDMLEESNLSKTALGAEWIAAGEKSLNKAGLLNLPLRLKGNFPLSPPRALSWKIYVMRGEELHLDLVWQSADSSLLYLDFITTTKREKIYSAASNEELQSLKVERNDTLIIRLQPQLLSSGYFHLNIESQGSFSVFPVYGKDEKAVWSFFGDVRDAGRRKHEGVDIFASRGTPVVAPLGGIVSSVRDGGLGGKSVFVRSMSQNLSLYFAHLDTQWVRTGQAVSAGDTLGLVGNTGNAKNTPPHLHFGIYSAGAIDPFPFLRNNRRSRDFPWKEDLPELMITRNRSNLRAGPGTAFPVIGELERSSIVYPLALTEDWYFVETPDHQRAFLHSSLMGGALQNEFTQIPSHAYWHPFREPGDSIDLSAFETASGAWEEKGKFQEYTLLQNAAGMQLWIREEGP